jgi:LuxR family transcriptional regulator, maltose regulon positive regulatory protein
MPMTPLHTLLWSQDQSRYELYTRQQLAQAFEPEDFGAWLIWLQNATAFAFRGACGSLNVYLEARRRGGHYWYAYHTNGKHTRKRYLGRTTQVTFARLEEAARSLHKNSSSSSPGSQSPQEPALASDGVMSVTPSEAEQGMVLLSTQLAPPLLPSLLVGRDRLLTRLDEAVSHRLTLLSASAGWGKTILLATWASRCAFPLAWLSLDELDNAPTRFWISVLSALRTCLPGVGQTALSMLHSPQPPPLSTILTTLLNELSGQATPTFLLLDDYHLIDEQAIHDSVLFLLEHLPAHLHLVLSSRIDPPLALARLRVRGQLLELRDADLRFEEEETACFLTHTMNLSLSEAEIVELARRTEGWIAGLQLAAISLMHHPDRAAFVHGFMGSHRYVLDYVQEEILARLSPSMQDFVLSISILHRMSASLCQAVTAQVASQEMLETIERANLFLVPLDNERRWYRFHDLFREALLSHLHATQPELVPRLHQRAAHWYEGQGQFREAMAHWFAARDFSSAARLLERVARQFWLCGEATTMYHWMMQLPDALVREHAHLVLTSALYLLTLNFFSAATQWHTSYQEAQELMTQVETVLRKPEAGETSLPEKEIRLLEHRLHLLRAWSTVIEQRVRGEREQFRFIYQEMQDLEKDEEMIWQMIPLATAFIFYYVFRRDVALLVPKLQDVWLRAKQSADPFAMILVRRWLAQAYLRAGQLRQAYQESWAAIRLHKQAGGQTIQVGHSYLVLVLVLYQWNRLEEARSLLQSVIHDAAAWQHADLLAWSYRALVQIELAASELGAADQMVLQGEEHITNPVRDMVYHSWAMGIQVHWWLAVGKMAEADDWAAHVVFHQDEWEPHRAEEFLALIRVYLARAEYTQAVEALERFRSHLDGPADMAITIEFLSLSVVALQQAGMSKKARAVAARLLTLTEPEGHIRVYLDAGEAMKYILQSFLDAPQNKEHEAFAVSRSYVTTLLKAFEQEQRAETTPTLARQTQGLHNIAHSSLIEPLSPQEQRVLQSMCAGRSNREIAGELVVSINTVKAHVKKIYSKLQVRKRIEACQVARALRLFVEKTFVTSRPQSTQ